LHKNEPFQDISSEKVPKFAGERHFPDPHIHPLGASPLGTSIEPPQECLATGLLIMACQRWQQIYYGWLDTDSFQTFALDIEKTVVPNHWTVGLLQHRADDIVVSTIIRIYYD